MLTEWSFRIGGRFQPVRELLVGNDDLSLWYQRTERRVTSVVVTRQGNANELPPLDSDDRLISRIMIGLLQRGDASTVSPGLERELLEIIGCDAQHPTTTHSNTQLRPIEDVVSQESLFASVFDRTTTPIGSFDSEAEASFYELVLRPILKTAVHFVDIQRPLDSMLKNSRAVGGVVDQRVDFALQTPSGLKVVFEIDGSQHEQASNAAADRVRDELLRQSGWTIERIPVRRLLQGGNSISIGLLKLIEADPVISLALSQEVSDDSRFLALVPHEIHRIQLAVLMALHQGDLSLDDSQWNIAIIERDHCIADFAMKDLHVAIAQLCALYGVASPPRINLFRVLDPALDRFESAEYQYVVVTELRRDQLDLRMVDVIIDSSLSGLDFGSRGESESGARASDLPGHTPVYSIRTTTPYVTEEILEWVPARPIAKTRDASRALHFFLAYLFRRNEFRPMQQDIIERAMSRRDVLGLLPTGGGKSLTFQMATLLSPGVSIVVAPLKSLIDDQVYNLHLLGINRVAGIHSGKTASEKSRTLASFSGGGQRFIFIAPERFQSDAFRTELQGSAIRQSVVFGVIDEAHCVSEWGHQFRPSYLMVGKHAREMFAPEDGLVPLMALTATASTTVLSDIQRELDFDSQDDESIVEVISHARNNLNFLPLGFPDSRKSAGLDRALEGVSETLGISVDELLDDPENAGIVFCRYVNGKYGVVGVRSHLAKKFGDDAIQVYAGSAPKNVPANLNWDLYKASTQRSFKRSEFPLLVSTSAFGMGVDKGNLRYTIHYGIPDSTEALVQESGRSGRDGREAVCAVIYSAAENAEHILDPDLDAETVRERIRGWDNPSDVKRILFLNSLSYPGVSTEHRSLNAAYQQVLGEWSQSDVSIGEKCPVSLRPIKVSWESLEKTVYRMSVLGIVDDYTIDWASRIIHCETKRVSIAELWGNLKKYFDRYPNAKFRQSQAISEDVTADDLAAFNVVSEQLIAFSYDQLERARRQALANLVGFLEDAKSDGLKLRSLITEFLTRNSFTTIARTISNQFEVTQWFGALDQIQYDRDRIDLARAVQRQLEAEANHPGLRAVYLVASAADAKLSAQDAVAEISASISDFRQDVSRTQEDLSDFIREVAVRLSASGSGIFDEIVMLSVNYEWAELFLRASHDHVKSKAARALTAVPVIRDTLQLSRDLFSEVQGGT